MAVKDWSTNPDLNTLIDAVSIAENCPPGNMNDMGRRIMASVRTWYSSVPVQVADRTALKALSTSANTVAYLAEAQREGMFLWASGNYSANVTADPYEGVYVAPAADPTGASGVWVRKESFGPGVRPEWFGAYPNDSSIDCAPRIQSALNAGYNVRLSAGKYYLGTGSAGVGTFALEFKFNGQVIEGVAASKDAMLSGGTGKGTELILKSASMSGVLMGFTTSPGGTAPNTWREGCVLKNLSIRRLVGSYPLGNPVSGVTNAPCGVRMSYAAVCTIENVYAFEHSIGFWISATVACKLRGCRNERYTAGTSAGNDFSVGFYQDNSLSTPYNSGNASLIYSECGAFSNHAAGYVYTYSAGLQTYQGFTDTFVEMLETANCGYGIDAHGRSSSAGDWHTEDLIVTRGVFDGCRNVGINVETGGPNSAVRISDCYVGTTVATGPVSVGIRIAEIHGSVSLSGNQMIGAAGNPATGLLIYNSSGVTSSGGIVTNFQDPIVLDGVVWARIEDRINAGLQGPLTAGVQVTNTQNARIACDIAASGAFTFPVGVKMLGTANTGVEVNCTGIYTPSITGGAANKLVHNGTQITATGAFGTNCLASGIMA